MSSTAFRAFSCERFDTGREFLRADYSVECSTATHVSEAHEAAKELALAAIMIYPVGISVMYIFAFAYTRPAIRENRPTELSRAIGFLSQDFEPEYLWWEARSCKSNYLPHLCPQHSGCALTRTPPPCVVAADRVVEEACAHHSSTATYPTPHAPCHPQPRF